MYYTDPNPNSNETWPPPVFVTMIAKHNYFMGMRVLTQNANIYNSSQSNN